MNTEKKPGSGSSHPESSGELPVVVNPHSDRNTSCVFISGLGHHPPQFGDYSPSNFSIVPEAVSGIPGVWGEYGEKSWALADKQALVLAGAAVWERSIPSRNVGYSALNSYRFWRSIIASPEWGHAPQAEFLMFPEAAPELDDALEDLRECQDEAREKGFPIPTVTALNNAERLLKSMFGILPHRFEVYPMPSGAIAIQASKTPEIAMSVLCESDGGALCLVSATGHSRRARYSTANDLPDGFLLDALQDLRRFGG